MSEHGFRMPSTNHVIMAGRLTRDPEMKYTATGTAVCNFSIANDRHYQGEKQTIFVPVTVWAKAAEYCGDNLRKGAPVIVVGRWDTESWLDSKTQQERHKDKITALTVEHMEFGARSNTGEPEGHYEGNEPSDDW